VDDELLRLAEIDGNTLKFLYFNLSAQYFHLFDVQDVALSYHENAGLAPIILVELEDLVHEQELVLDVVIFNNFKKLRVTTQII